MSDTMEFTALGKTVRGSITAEQLETFPAPAGLQEVTFESAELTALCPVTHQPDLYHVTIRYRPDAACVESKSLKLYLMGFRNTGIFAETIATTIARDLRAALVPLTIEVTTRQQVRGGLTLEARCVL